MDADLIVGSLEGFLRDHVNGEFEWNEVVNIFGPEHAAYFINCKKRLDDLESYNVELEQENNRLREAFSNAVGVAPLGSFSWALMRVKEGTKIARHGWNGKGMWIVLVPSAHWGMCSDVPFDWGQIGNDLLPWIGMKTADNKFVPWLASQTDMLADDWEEVG